MASNAAKYVHFAHKCTNAMTLPSGIATTKETQFDCYFVCSLRLLFHLPINYSMHRHFVGMCTMCIHMCVCVVDVPGIGDWATTKAFSIKFVTSSLIFRTGYFGRLDTLSWPHLQRLFNSRLCYYVHSTHWAHSNRQSPVSCWLYRCGSYCENEMKMVESAILGEYF